MTILYKYEMSFNMKYKSNEQSIFSLLININLFGLFVSGNVVVYWKTDAGVPGLILRSTVEV
jgi:hypothetical protein